MEEYFLVGFRVGQGQLGCSGRTTTVTQEEAGWNFFFFFAEFESLLCEVFNVKRSTNFRSTNATHQRSHCSTRQFKKCKVTTTRKKKDFFIDDRRGWGKMAYASQGHFPKCFFVHFLSPFSLSLGSRPSPNKRNCCSCYFSLSPPPPFSQERAAWWRSGIVTHGIRLDWAEKDPRAKTGN